MSVLLYDRLPAIVRERDAAEGFPLRALLGLVQTQHDLVEADIRQLWNDLFVETARPWAIPYIGDLVGNDLLYDATRFTGPDTAAGLFPDLVGPDLRPPLEVRIRADVAKTIYYRRRKGTPPMLEELARDVTGWPAHAVEMFELLGWTQHPEHVRPWRGWTDVRPVEAMDRVDGAFDTATHTVDVRRIPTGEGRLNVPNVAFFLWRLRSYPLANVPARRAGPAWRWHASPLGNRAPLFSRWRREGDEAGLATELHVGGPIRPAFFAGHVDELYGDAPDASIRIGRNGTPVAAAQIVCRRLEPWPAAQPVGPVVAVDVAAGRIAVGDGFGDATDAVDVTFHYGFPADLGGGPYERRRWLVKPDLGGRRYRVREDGAAPATHSSVVAALAEWATPSLGGRADAVIEILDSRTYALPAAIALAKDSRLTIQAANGQRPLLQAAGGELEVQADPIGPGDPERRAELALSGVAIEGFVHVTGDLRRLRLLHSTLVPGRALTEDGEPQTTDPSVVVEQGPEFRLEAAFSIAGPLVVPAECERVSLLDSIVDGLGGTAVEAPALAVERSTLLGEVRARSLDLSESICTGPVRVERTQTGCARFSFVPPGSRTPRRYRCQPDLAAAQPGSVAGRLVPAFTTERYGLPGYAQLRVSAPRELREGAEDGSEMGAYCHLKQPQRESNLRIRLEEYLPFGLEAGLVYVT